mmetsp:Transcript_28929/g.68199  ORF Transcript_28929/g.68199 Transcript_28929/m.68199 type:complete len:301 (-) Transcript_28929:35-937(-)
MTNYMYTPSRGHTCTPGCGAPLGVVSRAHTHTTASLNRARSYPSSFTTTHSQIPVPKLQSLGTTQSFVVPIAPRRGEDLLLDLIVIVIVVATRPLRVDFFVGAAALVALDLIEIALLLLLTAVVVGRVLGLAQRPGCVRPRALVAVLPIALVVGVEGERRGANECLRRLSVVQHILRVQRRGAVSIEQPVRRGDRSLLLEDVRVVEAVVPVLVEWRRADGGIAIVVHVPQLHPPRQRLCSRRQLVELNPLLQDFGAAHSGRGRSDGVFGQPALVWDVRLDGIRTLSRHRQARTNRCHLAE